MVVSWLLGTLQHPGPFPLLAIAGEQGSAKTVLSKILRALVDPNVAPVRALPREERELMIAANNSHVLAFDNLSSLLGVHSRYGLHTRAVTVHRDTLSEGFSHFVTSIAAPVASGWSVCRVGLSPTGKRRLFTAHTPSGHCSCGAARHPAPPNVKTAYSRRGIVAFNRQPLG